MGAIRDDMRAGNCMDSAGVGEDGRPDYVAAGGEVLVKREWVEQVTDWCGKRHRTGAGGGIYSLEQQWRGYVSM